MAVFLGCLVAAGFGSADFVGGRASMDASTWAVLLVAQLCAVVGALVLALAVGAHTAPHDFLFGAASGVVTILGLALLYRGLATGSMGIVAPVTAVVGALIPIVWGLAHGERPSGVVLAGVGVAVSTGALVAREPGPVASRAARGVELAALALVLLAVHKGLLVVVAALAALAPGVTALLAWRVLDERLSAVQQLGLVLALTGLVLVSVG